MSDPTEPTPEGREARRASHHRSIALVTALTLGETAATAEIVQEALDDDPSGMMLALASLAMGLIVHAAEELNTTPEALLRRLGPGVADL